jgi:hypothetical protein
MQVVPDMMQRSIIVGRSWKPPMSTRSGKAVRDSRKIHHFHVALRKMRGVMWIGRRDKSALVIAYRRCTKTCMHTEFHYISGDS